jgi:ssDNA-binding replication factor A large subunit
MLLSSSTKSENWPKSPQRPIKRRVVSNNAVVISLQICRVQTQKRELIVVDDSKSSVRLTLWGKQAEQFNTAVGSVIAFKGVRVSEFNGKWNPSIYKPS